MRRLTILDSDGDRVTVTPIALGGSDTYRRDYGRVGYLKVSQDGTYLSRNDIRALRDWCVEYLAELEAESPGTVANPYAPAPVDEARLEALRIASGGPPASGSAVVERAAKFARFLKGD